VPHYRFLSKEEHRACLADKVVEEARELANTPPESIAEEISVVQQALDDLRRTYGISKVELNKVMRAKRIKSGGFGKGLFIESLDLKDGDPWIEYYRKEPERFHEATSIKGD
jgi:predicted house-cleaning noncanonical NTP pyrophosphatase (MazG superfamily)